VNSRPLAGASVLQTRPEHQSAELTEAITAAGGNALAFPVIDIVGRDTKELSAALANAAPADIVIFVSRNAVDHGLSLAPAGSRLAAIGKATASAIEAAGRRVDIQPRDGFDSEALLAEAALQDIAGKRILIVRGDGGRELLQETLTARGAEVTMGCVYERRRQQPSPLAMAAVVDACKTGNLHYLVAMSVASLEQMLALLPEGIFSRLPRARLVTPSSRVIMAAGDRAPGVPALLAQSPAAADMVEAMGADWQQQTEAMND
jgi:uroporphyrinogen-III synthase